MTKHNAAAPPSGSDTRTKAAEAAADDDGAFLTDEPTGMDKPASCSASAWATPRSSGRGEATSLWQAQRRTPESSCFAPVDPEVTPDHIQMRQARDDIGFSPLRRAALAVVQVPTDFNMDSEAAFLIAKFPGVELRMQKITGLGTDLCTPESFLPARKNIRDAAMALTPNDYCNVAGLACTSMSFTLGPEIVDAELQIAHPNAHTLDMARSQLKALRTMGCTNVGLVTPYIDLVHINNVKMLESGGDVTVAASVNLGLVKSEWSSMVDQQTIIDAVQRTKAISKTPLDAVVIGCSALRVCVPGFITDLESTTGVNIVTSTQSFYWNCLRTGGVDDQIDGYGRLFSDF